jgi:hypothetical protein
MDERQEIDGRPAANGAAGHGASMSPVLAGTEARVLEPARQSQLPVPVVAAAGGAVVGAVAYALLRVLRRPARRGAVRIGRRRGRRRALEVTGSRSFLVDVHMLKR